MEDQVGLQDELIVKIEKIGSWKKKISLLKKIIYY